MCSKTSYATNLEGSSIHILLKNNELYYLAKSEVLHRIYFSGDIIFLLRGSNNI